MFFQIKTCKTWSLKYVGISCRVTISEPYLLKSEYVTVVPKPWFNDEENDLLMVDNDLIETVEFRFGLP